MLQQLLYKYLILNGQLGLPEIGRFTIHRQPAAVDETGRVLVSPTQQIRFETVTVNADKNLFLFLAHETGSDEVSAISQFNEWVKSVREKLAGGSAASLPWIGMLRLTGDGTYSFDPLNPSVAWQTVELPEGMIWKAATTEEAAVIENADSGWWIYAVILLLLSIAAIAYHYL